MTISREDAEHIVRRARQHNDIDIKQLENILWPITEGNLGNKAALTVESVKGMIELEIENQECHIRANLGHGSYGEDKKRGHKIEALKELLQQIEINEAENDTRTEA